METFSLREALSEPPDDGVWATLGRMSDMVTDLDAAVRRTDEHGIAGVQQSGRQGRERSRRDTEVERELSTWTTIELAVLDPIDTSDERRNTTRRLPGIAKDGGERPEAARH